ncbi:energy-coupling factor transporter transmembrane protein EcfT [Roseburia sp. MUC/MUC-530-WT-4D]|uniref:Energy-coupling factor transporter transmembrane protein EcfT n=1 Tax=Roseburia porci TaxID=2605790 RepID=A0A6L5YMY2_9FIRM|nr:energy-coupling factor transporter transmembrane component T [Roseburia porci]MST73775.1 energy-coupling factor transporter transmembrane protein EcfT [Roseburia porci]
MAKLLTYEKKDTWIDRLCGVTKLIFFLAWSITSMLTYDTRVLAVMFVISLVLFQLSKTDWKQVGGIFKLIMIFMIINLLAIFIFAPEQGSRIYGTETVLFPIAGNYVVTAEQLFYELNILLKYFTIVPSVFIFIVTTDPSEFAASLNRIGISYNIGYAISVALRYIPDVQDDFHKIRNAQEARGIEMSSKAKFMDRVKNTASIIFPLIFTSMERIDTVSNAMELRGYGKHKKRTWYTGRKLQKADYMTIAVTLIFMAAALVITYHDGSRFYNPFL